MPNKNLCLSVKIRARKNMKPFLQVSLKGWTDLLVTPIFPKHSRTENRVDSKSPGLGNNEMNYDSL
jgi:hypothetical protein